MDITREQAEVIDAKARAKGLTIRAERVSKTSRSKIWIFGLYRGTELLTTAFSRAGLSSAVDEF